MDASDPIIEWEISVFPSLYHYAVVGQIVLRPEWRSKQNDLVPFLCKKYHLDAVKFYDSFENSDVTGKRDYQLLKADNVGYLAPTKNGIAEIAFNCP